MQPAQNMLFPCPARPAMECEVASVEEVPSITNSGSGTCPVLTISATVSSHSKRLVCAHGFAAAISARTSLAVWSFRKSAASPFGGASGQSMIETVPSRKVLCSARAT